MTPAIVGLWLSAAMLLPPSPAASDLHLVVESQFKYQASVRTTTMESWSAPQKTAMKVGDRLTIRREDLGVRWRIDLKAGTYTEDRIVPPPPAPAEAKEDIHTAGYDYEPAYDWVTHESNEKTTIAGRPCRQVIATGDADYSEATVKFWICEPIAAVGSAVNDSAVSSMRSPSARKMVLETAEKHAKAWVLGVEERQEPAIAPTVLMTITVRTLETTPLSPETFELPANVKKAGR